MVYESLVYSAWLRLASEVDSATRKMFIEEVMELMELVPLRDSLVSLPGVDGLSTEQCKRLTIVVELVANTCIIFMDEPTSGLDARAAAIVMRTVRNTVDTRRTVVCTIHQPIIDIFEAFDELFLMKRGGGEIYVGPLGHHSSHLISYFENDLYKQDWRARKRVQIFQYIVLKWTLALIIGLGPGLVGFFNNLAVENIAGFKLLLTSNLMLKERTKQQDLFNSMGLMYSDVLFLGISYASSVQPVVAVERTVFYRERPAGINDQ